MLSPTTRRVFITYFDVDCLDPEHQKVITLSLWLVGTYDKGYEIMEKVIKKGLVAAPLIPKRITNIEHVIEHRVMSADYFFKNSTIKKEKRVYYEGSQNKSNRG